MLRKLLIAVSAIFCFSMAAFAQKPENTPKPNPPIIIVPPKPDEKPKGDKPKDDDRKKPDIVALDVPRRMKFESA